MSPRHTRHLPGAIDDGARAAWLQARHADVRNRSKACRIHMGASGHYDLCQGIFETNKQQRLHIFN